MASFNKFDIFTLDKNQAVHNFNPSGGDQITVALTNVAPTATTAVLADITEISYTGLSSRNVTTTGASQTSGTFKLTVADLTLNATASVGPFRYVVLYNSGTSVKTNPLIGYYDYGSSITLLNGESLTLDFDDANGLYTDA